ncbi:hypothetical protein B6264_22790 [Kitasatospora aureofaciens]|nr:hypothetical protein B6264_22790 [Kitasatospora aureofaciens]
MGTPASRTWTLPDSAGMVASFVQCAPPSTEYWTGARPQSGSAWAAGAARAVTPTVRPTAVSIGRPRRTWLCMGTCS